METDISVNIFGDGLPGVVMMVVSMVGASLAAVCYLLYYLQDCFDR